MPRLLKRSITARLASLLRIRIRRNSSEQRCGIPELTSWGDAGTLDSIEDGVEPQSTEFCDVCFTAAIGRTATTTRGIRAAMPSGGIAV
jgi:hypothetical protein